MEVTGDETNAGKRQRISKACDVCRRKKIRCDGIVPKCTHCYNYGLECSYTHATKKRGPPKGYIEAIETRCHQLESLLGELAENDPKSSRLLDTLNSPLATVNGDIIASRPIRRKQDSPSAAIQREDSWFTPSTSASPSTSTAEKCADKSKRLTTQGDYPKQIDSNSLETTNNITPVNDSNGQLTMDGGGHVRYLGRSSGFYLLQGSRTYQNGVFRFSGYGPKTTTRTPKSNHHVDPLVLPPTDLSEHLMELYFQHFYPLLPLFYKRQLICSANANEPPSPLLLNSIYAISSRISSDPRVRSDPSSQATAGDIFFERAKCLLDGYYDVPTISTVQALLLLAGHQQGTMKYARAWLYCGMAFRMALDLGLHRNCDHWQISSDEKEQRKRVFWCCFIMDRLTAATYGRTLCFDEHDIDVPFPSGDDDEPIQTDTNQQTSPRTLDIFINGIKICHIMGHVLKNIYYARAPQQHIHHLEPLHQQLTSWLDNLPPSLQYQLPDTELGETAADPPLVIGQLHMIYYTTMILLHRSFISGPSEPTEPQSPLSSYGFCVSGAKSILNIINIMRGENHLKCVLNSSVYFAFTAGIIFIKMASSSDEFEVAFDAKVNVNKIMHALNDMEETWPNASRCRIILGELAGLIDIKLEDNKYVPRKIGKPAKPPPAIAVPNSPESSSLDNTGVGGISDDDNDRRGNIESFDQQQARNTTTPVASGDRHTMNDEPPISPLDENQQHQRYSTTTSIKPTMDPFAAPNSVMNPHDQPQPKTSLVGSAFSGLPTSLDVEAWDQYFAQSSFTTASSQQQQQQQQQALADNIDNGHLLPFYDLPPTAHHYHQQHVYNYPRQSQDHTTITSPLHTSTSSPLPSSTTTLILQIDE